MTTARVTAEPKKKTPSESLNIRCDFTLYGLDTTELFTGTPTVEEQGTADLVIDNKTVNTAAFSNSRGRTVAIGKGLQFRVSGGVDGQTYTIKVGCSTDASPSQYLEAFIILEVGGASD